MLEKPHIGRLFPRTCTHIKTEVDILAAQPKPILTEGIIIIIIINTAGKFLIAMLTPIPAETRIN
jgi:hypothetical protein